MALVGPGRGWTFDGVLQNLPSQSGDIDTVTIQINVDGLPLFKSFNTQLWPTLGKLVNQQEQEPVIIGICYGSQKPTNLVEYLTEFVTETNTLEEYGMLWQEACIQMKVTTALSQPNTDTPKSGRRGWG